MGGNTQESGITALLEHAESVPSDMPLSNVQLEFSRRKRRYLGVVGDAGRLVGVASAREISELLSRQFGRALFDRAPVREHTMSGATLVAKDTPLTDVLKAIAERSAEQFHQDVALVDETGRYLGLIPAYRLARVQYELLLENLDTVEEQRRLLAERNRRIEQDMLMAREVQLALLPDTAMCVEHGGLRVRARYFYQSAAMIGGDFVALFSPSPGTLVCCLFDVMGHGVRSALITAMLRTLIEEEVQAEGFDATRILPRVNHMLQQILRQTGELIFVTAVCACIDLAKNEIAVANAGHPCPLIKRAGTAHAVQLELPADSLGPALGLLEEAEYTCARLPLAVGDALLFFTDGIEEVIGEDGDELGRERLGRLFAEVVDDPSAEVSKAVVERARGCARSGGFDDDVCVVSIQCEPAAPAHGECPSGLEHWPNSPAEGLALPRAARE